MVVIIVGSRVCVRKYVAPLPKFPSKEEFGRFRECGKGGILGQAKREGQDCVELPLTEKICVSPDTYIFKFGFEDAS